VALALVSLLPAQAAESGWCLVQKSTSIGDQKIWISPSYLRIESKNSRTVTFAAAPEWKVITYSKVRKIYYITTPANFTARFAFVSGTFNRTNLGALQYIKGEIIHDKGNTSRSYRPAATRENTYRQNDERVWNPKIEELEDSNLSKQSMIILAHLYNLPVLDGVPLSVNVTVESNSVGRKLRAILETTAISKCKVETGKDPSLKDFKLCQDEQAFSNANNDSIDLKDFTDYIGPK